jgi:hypothetical protein
MTIIENGVIYSTIVYGTVTLMLTGVILIVVKMLKAEGTRPEDDHL